VVLIQWDRVEQTKTRCRCKRAAVGLVGRVEAEVTAANTEVVEEVEKMVELEGIVVVETEASEVGVVAEAEKEQFQTWGPTRASKLLQLGQLCFRLGKVSAWRQVQQRKPTVTVHRQLGKRKIHQSYK